MRRLTTVKYTYLANSLLVSNVVFKSNATVRLTTTKQYDYLNRLQQISSAPGASGVSAVTFSYAYNNANQRTRRAESDASYWIYQYDSLGQVTSGKKYWSDGTPVPGQQFEYAHDEIGNRTSTKAGGNAAGSALRTASYSANTLNQYTSRDVPNAFDVLGASHATNSVTVNNSAADYRRGEYFQELLTVVNSSTSVWQTVSVTNSGGGSTTGSVFVAKTPEAFTYDQDGNLTNDGRWTLTWDAENRLVLMETLSSVPELARKKLAFSYDWQARRISKTASNWVSGNWQLGTSNKFIYDGWNPVAELASNNALVRSFVWGSDLSGSMQGAGGVGGLLQVAYYGTQTTNCFAAYDGNGNVAVLVNAADGNAVANYEYDPFGQTIRATGVMATNNPFRFSTKYIDDQSDFSYYGYRSYNPSTGRWLNRDPIGEDGGVNLYGFVKGDALRNIDFHGLCGECCECAVDIQIKNAKSKPYVNDAPATFFDVDIFLEYHPSAKKGRATYKWEENSNYPPKAWLEKGAKPNQWYDAHALDPTAINPNWQNRPTSCDPPVGRKVLDYDWAAYRSGQPQRILHIRLTIVNPKNCDCEKESVTVTAVQTSNDTQPPTFQTPDPSPPK